MHRPVRSGGLAFQSGTAFRSVLALAAGTLFSFLIAAPGVMGQQAERKLDPVLRAMLLRLQQAEELQQPLRDPYEMDRVHGASRAEAEAEPWVRVFVRGGSPGGAVASVGGAVGSQAGDIVTARVPLSQLSELASLGGVDWIQAATLQYVTMDSVLIETGADVVQSSYGYTGTGVTVGVLDTGIDYAHADFIRSTGTSRVLFLWDQTINDPTRYPSGYSYGTEWAKTDIDDEIDGTPAGVITQYDYNGHGTHVAGIAAGNGLATGSYTGMAPDANLIIVKGGDGSFYDADVVDGVNYIFGKASALGQPCVVNLSLGGHSGPHDGTSLYEQALDGLVGPGQIIVAAAGNEGSDYIHHRSSLSGIADVDSFQVEVPSYTPNSGSSDDYILFNIWYYGGSNITISLRAPSGYLYGPVTAGAWDSTSTAEGYVLCDNASGGTDPYNFDKQVVLQVYDRTAGIAPAAGTWSVIYEMASMNSGTVDCWVYDSSMGAYVGTPYQTSTYTVGSPATATEVIAVGAYVSKDSWMDFTSNSWTYSAPKNGEGDYALFSSWGPSRDGRQKPEIMAPGKGIFSAMSNDMTYPGDSGVAPGENHRLSQGTSQAAPVVSGAVALLLEIDGSLTATETRGILQGTAVTDAYTGSVPNDTWGYGKLDVQAAADSLLGAAAIAPDVHLYAPGGVQAGSVTITYSIKDSDLSTVSLSAAWSDDYGGTWSTATVSGAVLAITAAEYDSFFVWETGTDIAGDALSEVWLRVTPSDIDGSGPEDVIRIPLDNMPPQTLHADGDLGSDVVVFGFDEMVREAEALNPSSYTVNSGALTPQSVSVSDHWNTVADSLTFARRGAAAVVIDGDVYVVGGHDGNGYLGTLQRYDPGAETWTTLTSMPTARANPTAAVIDGVLYVVGGFTATNTPTSAVEYYDPQVGTWETGAPMPTARGRATGAVLDGRLYVACGSTPSATNAFEVYDPNTDTWDTSLAQFTVNRYGMAGGTIGGKIYLACGANDVPNHYLNAYSYDPATDTWSSLAPAGISFTQSAYGVFNDRLYLASGETGSPHTVMEYFDPGTNAWTRVADLPEGRSEAAGVFMDGYLYVAGGFDGTGSERASVYEYDPQASFQLNLTSPETLPGGTVTLEAAGITDVLDNTATTLSKGFTPLSPNPPSVAVYEPDGLQAGDIRIPFLTEDADGSTLGLFAEFSLDDGTTWLPASIITTEGDTTGIVPAGYDSSLVWDTATDLGAMRSFDVPFRMTVHDETNAGPSDVTQVDVDNLPPSGMSAAGLIGDSVFRMAFIERVDEATAVDPSHYTLDQGLTVSSIEVNQSWAATPIFVPTNRNFVGVGSLGRYTYVVGGTDGVLDLSVVEIYDVSGTWSSAAPMPTRRKWPNVVSVEGLVYVIGGFSSAGNLRTVEIYDPASNMWSSGADSPVSGSKYVATAVVVEGRIYLYAPTVGRFYVYDPHFDTWTDEAAAPTNAAAAIAEVEGKIYIAGGENAGTRNELYVFDPATGITTALAAMPTARSSAVGASMSDGHFYVMGGNGGSGPLATVEIYDITTGLWGTGRDAPVASDCAIGSEYAARVLFGSWNTGALHFQTYTRPGFTVTLTGGQSLPNATVTVDAANIPDLYGNVATALQVLFDPQNPDVDPPTTPDTVFLDGQGVWTNTSDWQSSADFTMELDWTTADDPSGIARTYYKLDSAPTAATDTTGSFPGNVGIVTATTEGGQSVFVWCEDGAGNVDYTFNREGTMRWDATPMGAPTSLTANGSNPSPWTNSDAFQILSVAPADGSGPAETYYKLGAVPGSPSDTTGSFDGLGPHEISIAPLTSSVTAYVWLVDLAGNHDPNNHATVDLRLDVDPPNLPTLSSPTGGATVTEIRPTLLWTNTGDAASGVAGFEVQVSELSDFSTLFESTSTDGATSSYTLTTDIWTATWYWRVRAQDAAGNYSSWNSDNFNATIATLEAPTGLSPSLAWVNDTVEFAWNAVSGADFYTVQCTYFADTGYAVPIFTETPTATSHAYSLSSDGDGSYRWRVRAETGGGESGPWSEETFGYDNTAPSVSVGSLPSNISQGDNVAISATVTDGSGIDAVVLRYRTTGASSYAQSAMSTSNNLNFNGTIPGSYVTVNGFEYAVAASDLAGNQTVADEGGEIGTGAMGGTSISVPNLPSSGLLPADRWQMISVPHYPDNRSVTAILSNLPQYDTTVWRFFRWASGQYVEESTANLTTGQAYWLHHREANVRIDPGSGATVPGGSPFQITLRPGWNDIGSPWLFDVPWNQVLSVSGLTATEVAGPYTYTTSWQLPPSIGVVPAWSGIAVYNRTGGNRILQVPPIDASAVEGISLLGRPTLAAESIAVELESALPTVLPVGVVNEVSDDGVVTGWRLQLIATQEGAPSPDIQNYVGALSGHTEAWESDEYPDPPMNLDATVRLHVDRRNRGQLGDLYATDYLAEGEPGWQWPVRVESTAGSKKASIAVSGIEGLPAGLVVALTDEMARIRIDMTPEGAYRFYPSATGERPGPDGFLVEHRFRLVVGSQAYVDGETAGLTRLPNSMTLDQNFPNPFNPTTTIRFALNEPTRVRLTVLNVRGQQVKVVADGLFNAGPQQVSWDGTNENGQRVATGIYFYRLEAGRTVLTKKMTLIR